MLTEKVKDYFGPLCKVIISKNFTMFPEIKKLLVKSLSELSENEKEFTSLIVTQAIININKAWRQVAQSTIVDCWRKADILDNENIDYSKYLDLDSAVQTCVDLTDEERVNFCMKKTSVEKN